MQVSIEITLVPLHDDYEASIKSFIRLLRASEFQLIENALSTQIFGEFSSLMPFLESAISECFSSLEAGMIHLKIVKSNRSNYVPFD